MEEFYRPKISHMTTDMNLIDFKYQTATCGRLASYGDFFCHRTCRRMLLYLLCIIFLSTNLACFAFSLGHRGIICKIASIFSLRSFYPATIAKGISKIR